MNNSYNTLKLTWCHHTTDNQTRQSVGTDREIDMRAKRIFYVFVFVVHFPNKLIYEKSPNSTQENLGETI